MELVWSALAAGALAVCLLAMVLDDETADIPSSGLDT